MTMATGHSFGNVNIAGQGPTVLGDYHSTNIHHTQQQQQPNIDKILLESLLFERWDARLRNLGPALDHTCEWILTHPYFEMWLDPNRRSRHSCFLWLKGKPGSGKSTVLKKAMEWIRQQKPNYTILSYFFHARSPSELERSSLGLYRSLTYQLLSAYPDGTVLFTKMFSGKIQTGKISEEWTVTELQNFWLRLLADYKPSPCFVFIDALDEGGEDDVRNMIDFTSDLVEKSRCNDNSIFFHLSSRHDPNITIENSLSVVMEEQGGHQDDIRLYIAKKLKGGTSQEMDELRRQVFTRSQGIFLWATLVVSTLNRWYDQYRSTRNRINCLQKIPINLHNVFSQILFENGQDPADPRDSQDMEERIILFRWVLFSKRALEPVELSVAVRTSISRLQGEETVLEAENGEESAQILEGRLIHLARGLIEFSATSSQSVVQLIHETVREFLLGKPPQIGGNQYQAAKNEFTTNFDEGVCHCAIAKDCLSRLMVVASDTTLSQEKEILTNYAARYWWQHLQAAGDNADEELLRLASELLLTSSYRDTWLQPYRDIDRWTGWYATLTELRQNKTPLDYAAFIGHQKLFDAMLDQSGSITSQEDFYRYALQIASLHGYERIVQILLDKGADVNAQKGDYGDALQAASSRGKERIVQMLLYKGADVNAQGGFYSNSLQAASYRGNERVVQMLLDKGADIDAQGGYYGTALYAAVDCGNEKVVQMLLDKGADVNAQGGFYSNSLQAASYGGNKRVVQMLLDKGADVNAQGGSHGTALHAAVFCSNEKMVQVLLEGGANANALGCYYDNGKKSKVEGDSIQAASARGCENIVRILREARASWQGKLNAQYS